MRRSIISLLIQLSCFIGISLYGSKQLHNDFLRSTADDSSLELNAFPKETAASFPSHRRISLVTSFWATRNGKDANSTQNRHREEIEAAILANLQNPFLSQVVVILDSVNENTTDCLGFVHYMTRRSEKLTQSPSFALSQTNNHPTLPQLECIERRAPSSGQPTYFEMFHYATYHPSITSEIVIMSNADQVFDDTVSAAMHLSKKMIFVLSTHGYNASRVPSSVRQHYRALVGDDANETTDNRCVAYSTLQYGKQKRKYSSSWDSYVFHRSLLRGVLSENEKDNSQFTRLNFWRDPTAYYMNELGAENAALYDMTRYMIGEVTVWNACKIMRSWHFHLAPKMHHTDDENGVWPPHSNPLVGGDIFYEDFGQVIPQNCRNLTCNETRPNEPTSRVPPPHGFPPMCLSGISCYRDNQLSRSSYFSETQSDARLQRMHGRV